MMTRRALLHALTLSPLAVAFAPAVTKAATHLTAHTGEPGATWSTSRSYIVSFPSHSVYHLQYVTNKGWRIFDQDWREIGSNRKGWEWLPR